MLIRNESLNQMIIDAPGDASSQLSNQKVKNNSNSRLIAGLLI